MRTAIAAAGENEREGRRAKRAGPAQAARGDGVGIRFGSGPGCAGNGARRGCFELVGPGRRHGGLDPSGEVGLRPIGARRNPVTHREVAGDQIRRGDHDAGDPEDRTLDARDAAGAMHAGDPGGEFAVDLFPPGRPGAGRFGASRAGAGRNGRIHVSDRVSDGFQMIP